VPSHAAARTLVLLGDSILDNAPYTRPEPDTRSHLQGLLTQWSVQLLARDGATMGHVAMQLHELAIRPSVAVLSVGGNDATEHIGLLGRRSSSAQVFGELLDIADAFGDRYERVARAVVERAERLIVCTIYEVQLEPPAYARLARAPLAVLNDRIIRIAARVGADVLELRAVCTLPSDFVRQIEPSATGALKIARAIAHAVEAGAGEPSSRIFVGAKHDT
jgi:lysophospholipase L1-like esterase